MDKFRECKDCTIWEAYGPYLYENLEFMPRAYIVDKAILILGDKQNAGQIAYSLILNDDFNPKKLAVVQKKSANYGELENYYAVMLSEALPSNELNSLRNYVDNGGILLPNIFENKNSISEDDVKNLFKSLNESFEEIEILEYESNKAVYNVDGKRGFLVLSERFSNFPGWEATGKAKKEILKANVITTSVFVENEEKIMFKYRPQSFKNGSIISSVAVSLIISYFIFIHIKTRGDKNKA